jgi:ABC-type transport system involved in cytochrome c biogenesis permease subunit
LAELLFWPALVAYGEAVVAYFGNVRHPGSLGRAATWGVRLGWLVQTALLVAEAARADGFPWGIWAASLNLFVWLLVSGYLIWGCKPRYRVLGLVLMPVAVALLAISYLAGGVAAGRSHDFSTAFLVLHVGLVLVAFAGFTLSAGLAGLYLWQERRLKRHDAAILRAPSPALLSLDELATRTIAFALPALTAGIVIGLVRLRERGGGLDVLMAATLFLWCAYAALLVVRYGLGWRGRRIAYLVLAGFALVLTVRLGLPATHFA